MADSDRATRIPVRVDQHALLQEVAGWKLEAKLEPSARYFFHVDEVSKIENGRKAYVIGGKVQGKPL
jgi:hypothetical protein